MEEKRAFPSPLPLKVTPNEVSGRCMVMGLAVAQVGKPFEGWFVAGRK